MNWNQSLFKYLNSFAGKSAFFDNAVIFCADYLGYVMVIALLMILFFVKKDNSEKLKVFIFTGLSLIFSRLIVTEIIRYFYYVDRPFASPVFMVNNHIVQLVNHSSTASFPSGHAVIYFTFATAFFLSAELLGHPMSKLKLLGGPTPKLRLSLLSALFFCVAGVISIARVVGGVHWPLDILGGVFVAVVSTYFVYIFFRKYFFTK